MKNALNLKKQTLLNWIFVTCLVLLNFLFVTPNSLAMASLPDNDKSADQSKPDFVKQIKEFSGNNASKQHLTFNLDSNNAENKNPPPNRYAHRRTTSLFGSDK